MYNIFHEKYLQIIDRSILYKILSKKKQNLNKKPWIYLTISYLMVKQSYCIPTIDLYLSCSSSVK